MSIEPPLDHGELCARIRFRLDEPEDLPEDEVRSRELIARNHIARLHQIGVRVTPTLTPGLHAALIKVCRQLLLADPPRLYVLSDSDPNASAMHAGDRCFMTLTSGMANLLSIDEVGSVMGHELAHIGMRHANSDPSHPDSHHFVLERMRAMEVSSDRMAVLAGGGARVAVSAMLKTSSGLAAPHLTLDIDAFLAQLADRPEAVDAEWEAHTTHPMLPFRIWAMTRFAATDCCRALLGQEGGEPFDAVESEVTERFRAIGDGLAARQATDNVHEALAWLGTIVVCHDGRATEEEVRVLTGLVGSVWAEDAIGYHRVHGRPAVESRAKQSLAALRHAGEPTRKRVREHVARMLRDVAALDLEPAMEKLISEAWKR